MPYHLPNRMRGFIATVYLSERLQLKILRNTGSTNRFTERFTVAEN